jgi:HK97 family phage major capsid protein
MNAAGTTTVAWGGATSLGNYESLRFGVAKPEHKGGFKASAVFCGTETSYQRAKALPVGAADDRRLLGEGGMGTAGYSNYTIMGDIPYAINESMANTQVFYAILGRYRMYRRRGFTMRTSTEGDTNIRRNVMLMVVTARYGGQLERGATAAVTTTAPA